MADFAGAFMDLGGAVSSLFSAKGNAAEAGAYNTASSLAHQEAQIVQQSTAIQETQAQRQIYQSIGGAKADIAGAGLAESGTAQGVLRASAQQGALTKGLLSAQGQITAAGYEAQANSYTGMAKAASAASKGSGIAGILGGIGAIASLF